MAWGARCRRRRSEAPGPGAPARAGGPRIAPRRWDRRICKGSPRPREGRRSTRARPPRSAWRVSRGLSALHRLGRGDHEENLVLHPDVLEAEVTQLAYDAGLG